MDVSGGEGREEDQSGDGWIGERLAGERIVRGGSAIPS